MVSTDPSAGTIWTRRPSCKALKMSLISIHRRSWCFAVGISDRGWVRGGQETIFADLHHGLTPSRQQSGRGDPPAKRCLHPTPYTLHPTPSYTLHPAPYTLHPTISSGGQHSHLTPRPITTDFSAITPSPSRPQKALSGGIPCPFLEPSARSWSHFVGIYRQRLTKSSKK